MLQTEAPQQQEQHLSMSYEEFLHAVDEDTHAEWVNGEAIIFMPPDTKHQRIVKYLFLLLGAFVELFRYGEVLIAPYEMKASPDSNAREPDILFVARENLQRVAEKRLEGPADLAIEIISPESVARDRSDKFYEYQAAGVGEYWIIDPRPDYERADFWVLDASGQYRPVPLDDDGIYRSTVIPDFWFDVKWLWAEDAPDPVRAFAHIVGPSTLAETLGQMDETN